MAVTRITYYQDPGLTSVPYDVRPYTGGRSFYVQNSYIPYHYNPTLYTAPPNYIMDASNPLQINSVVDVVFNQAALNQISATDFQTHIPVLDELLGGAINYLKEQDVPGQLDLADVLQVPLGYAYYSRRATLDPIIGRAVSEKGLDKLSGFADAGINALINFSDTMDVLANPVKGMFLEKEGALKGLERGLGVGSEGRYAYNYNTGNPVSDFGLELISDPFNWIDFATSSIAKLVAKGGTSALKTAVSETAQQLGKNLSDDAAQFLVNRAVKFAQKNPDDLKVAMGSVIKAASKPGFGREAIELASDPLYSKVLQQRLVEAAQNSMNVTVLSSLHRMNKASNFAQSALMQAVGLTSGITPAFKAIRLIADPIANATYNAWLRSLQGIKISDTSNPTLDQFVPAMARYDTATAGLPNDVVDDWGKEMWKIMETDAVGQDIIDLYKIARSSSEPIQRLDEYFDKKVGKSFAQYVEDLKVLSETYPSLDYHYQDIAMLQDMLQKIQKMKKDQSILHYLRRDVKAVSDLLYDINRYRDAFGAGALESSVPLLNLNMRLEKILSDATHNPSLRDLAGALQRYLNDADYVTKAQHIDTLMPGLEGVRQAIAQQLDSFEALIPATEKAARNAIQDDTYLKTLEEAYQAGQDSPFKYVLDGDPGALSIRVPRGVIPQATIDAHLPKIKEAYGLFMLEVAQMGNYAEDASIDVLDKLMRNIDDTINDSAPRIYAQIQDMHIPSVGLSTMLDEFADILNAWDQNRIYSLKSGLTEYIFKESQVFAAKQLLDADASGVIHDLTEQIILRKDIGGDINQLGAIAPWAPLVDSLQGRAYAHQTYLMLLNNFTKDPLLKEIAPNLIDTLQSWKLASFDKLYVNRAAFLESFTQKVQSQLTALTAEAGALDKLFAQGSDLQKEFDAWLIANATNVTHAHDAEYDTLRVVFMAQKYQLPIDFEKHIPVFFDIETTGLQKNRDQILQIAWRTLDGRTGNLLAQMPEGLLPDHQLLAKLTDATLPYEEQVAMFTQRWCRKENLNQADLLKNFIAQLQQLEQELNTAGTAVRRVQLVGWNNADFDNPMLREAAQRIFKGSEYQYYKYLAGVPIMDGLREMRRMQGATQLSDAQITKIQSYLEHYLVRRWATEGAIPRHMNFIDTIDGDFARELKGMSTRMTDAEKEIAQYGDGVSPELSDVAKSLSALGSNMRNTATELNAVADDILTTLENIHTRNNALMNYRIYKDAATGALLDYKGAEIQLEGAVNTSRFMATRVGNLPEGAVKVRYKSSIVERVFEKLSDRKVTRAVMEQYYQYARSVAQIADNVRNTAIAVEYYTDFKRATDAILEQLQDFYKAVPEAHAPAYIQDIFPEITGTFDRYAQAQQLYNILKSTANCYGLGQELKAFIAQQDKTGLTKVFQIFAQPRCMMESYGLPIDDSFTDTFFHLNKQPLLAAGSEYTDALQSTKLKDLKTQIDKMSVLRDTKELRNASSQAGLSMLMSYYKTWERIEDWLEDIPFEGTEKDLRARMSDGKNALLQLAENTALSQLEWLAKLPAAQFEKYLWIANGRVTFAIPAYASPEYAAYTQGLINLFKERASELKDNHVHMQYDADTQRMFIWLDNSDEVIQKWRILELQHNLDESRRVQELNVAQPPEAFQDFYQDFGADLYQDIKPYFNSDHKVPAELLSVYRETCELTASLTRNRNLGTLGDMGSRSVMDAIDQHAPAYIRERMIPLDVFAEAEHFNTFSFNRSNLGLLSSRQELTNFVSGNIIKNYMNSAQSLVDVMDNRTKMMYLFFSKEHSLSDMFSGKLSAQDVFDMLKSHPELRLAGLVQDKKYGAIVQAFNPSSVERVQYFMAHPELQITVMPVHTFLQAHKAINNFHVGGTWLQQAYHWVVGPTKTGYLTSLGFVFRNIIDSTVKNMLLAGSPTEAGNMVAHMLETAKYYQRYRQILLEVQNFSDDAMHHASGMFSKQVLHRMYEAEPERMNALMGEDLFQLIHDFIEQGPSAGLSKIQQDAIQAKYFARLDKKGLPRPTRDLADVLTNNKLSQTVMSANSYLEQIFRLSGYTWALKEGSTTDAAMQLIFKHHFDYSAKSKAEMYAEYVIPFNGFMVSNAKFWMDSVDKYGWMAGLYRDFYSPFWDFQNRDEDEISRNRSIQYHILAGNLIFDNNLVMKLSPSAMDAWRLLTDPAEVLGRLAYYFRVPLETLIAKINGEESEDFLKTIATNLPLIGPALYKLWPENGMIAKSRDRLRGTEEELAVSRLLVTLLPSIFGAVQIWDDYNYEYNRQTHPRSRKVKKPYVRKAYPMRNSNPRGRRSRRTYARKTYATKSYVPKLYGQYTMAKIVSNVRKTQMRMPDVRSPLSRSTPGLYRRLYTGAGRSRFKSRMVQVTSRNLAARLRSDWIYVR